MLKHQKRLIYEPFLEFLIREVFISPVVSFHAVFTVVDDGPCKANIVFPILEHNQILAEKALKFKVVFKLSQEFTDGGFSVGVKGDVSDVLSDHIVFSIEVGGCIQMAF